MKKMIGIIGGMGPQATIQLMQNILNLTKSKIDQNQLPLCIWNDPRIPPRTDAILSNDTQEVCNYLVNSAKKLEDANCQFIIMPCNTAHFWADDIQKSINIPFVNMIDETLNVINKKNHKSIALLGTKGTIYSKIYEKSADKYNIKVNYPSDKDIDRLMNIINSIKANDYDNSWTSYQLYSIINNTKSDCAILGCTELSVIALKHPFIFNSFIFDPLQILTYKTIKLWNTL